MNGLRTLLGFFGFGLGTRINHLERDYDYLRSHVQYAKACEEVQKRMDGKLNEISKMQKEMRGYVIKLLEK